MSLRRAFTRSRRANTTGIDHSPDLSAVNDEAHAAASHRRHRGLGGSGTSASQINKPLQELEPWAVAEAQSWSPPTSPDQKFKDVFGNVIQDPDFANPFRSKAERPLDTIRSFEFAATGDRLQLKLMRAATDDSDRHPNNSGAYLNRRASQHHASPYDTPRPPSNYARPNYPSPRHVASSSAVKYLNEAAPSATPPSSTGNSSYQHLPVQNNSIFSAHGEPQRQITNGHRDETHDQNLPKSYQTQGYVSRPYSPPRSPLQSQSKRKSLKAKIRNGLSF